MPISTPTATMLQRLAILAMCILIALAPVACTRAADLSAENPAGPVGTGSPEVRLVELVPTIRVDTPTPVAVIVEVTRVVIQSVIIEATPAPPQPCAHAQFEATNEVTIGALLPLSGQNAFSAGFAMQTALSLAVERIQREGLLGAATPRLVTYDTAAHADRAAEFAHRLITLDCAAVIIGGYHNHVALATASVANAYQVPYIVLHAPADELTATPGSSVFRIAPSMSMYAQMPASLITHLITQLEA
ncbi:MAG: ABC transporter substrate-binding protein, partial [Litorilinea sp.]